MGTKKLRAALDRGDAVDAIVAADAATIAKYREERLKALLY